jgi:hypothetical protein
MSRWSAASSQVIADLITDACPGDTIVFPAEIKDCIVHLSASLSMVTLVAKEAPRESLDDCSNSDQSLSVI